jgi:hypothetical protein
MLNLGEQLKHYNLYKNMCSVRTFILWQVESSEIWFEIMY